MKKNMNKKSFTWITSLCFQNASINDSSTVSVHNTPCHRTDTCEVYSCCGCVDVCEAFRIVWRPFHRCYMNTVFLPCEFAHGTSDAASPRTSLDSIRICRVRCPCRSFHVAANKTTHWSSFRRCYRCETCFFFYNEGLFAAWLILVSLALFHCCCSSVRVINYNKCELILSYLALFRSADLKSQVSRFDRLTYLICLSICLSGQSRKYWHSIIKKCYELRVVESHVLNIQ